MQLKNMRFLKTLIPMCHAANTYILNIKVCTYVAGRMYVLARGNPKYTKLAKKVFL